jgi:hypothetical protein
VSGLTLGFSPLRVRPSDGVVGAKNRTPRLTGHPTRRHPRE